MRHWKNFCGGKTRGAVLAAVMLWSAVTIGCCAVAVECALKAVSADRLQTFAMRRENAAAQADMLAFSWFSAGPLRALQDKDFAAETPRNSTPVATVPDEVLDGVRSACGGAVIESRVVDVNYTEDYREEMRNLGVPMSVPVRYYNGVSGDFVMVRRYAVVTSVLMKSDPNRAMTLVHCAAAVKRPGGDVSFVSLYTKKVIE